MRRIVIDLALNAEPHRCVHVSKSPRAWASSGAALDRRRDFRAAVAALTPAAAKRAVAEPVRVRIQIWRRARRACDGDNLQKEILDALVDAGVLENDRWVRECCWSIEEQSPTARSRILIEIESNTRTEATAC